MVDFKARIAAGKAYEKSVVNKYKVPRFTVDGMNQSEFIQHVFIVGFMRGVAWKEKNNG